MNKKLEPRTISQRDAFLTYLPLAAMWIIMGVEQPALNAVIARLPAATVQLGAFGVTFALALVVESPILQMLSASTALAKDRCHYARLLRFMHILGGGLLAVHFILSVPSVFGFLIGEVAGVPEDLVWPAQRAFMWMIPFAAAVGYRRLWQGVLIKYGKAKLVPITMVIRLVVTVGLLLLGLFSQYAEGGQVAAIAIVGGVIAGAVASYVMARPVINGEMEEGSTETTPSFRWLISFYVPLSLTSIVVLASRPVLTVAIAQAPLPVPSLAAWPVLISFNFLFFSLALALQEAIIALHHSHGDFHELKLFTRRLSLGIGAIYMAIAATPLRDLWFEHVAGLGPDLIALLPAPSMIMALSPAIACFVFFYRGVNVQQERTMRVTRGVLVNLLVLLAIAFLGAVALPVAGVITAATAFTGAILLEAFYLRRVTGYWDLVFSQE